MKKEYDPDLLKPLEKICERDPRMLPTKIFDSQRGEFRPKTVEDHHRDISQINLDQSVPRKIVEQFETAKNVFLYAWFIYRFFPVSQHQALTSLELSLRERFQGELPKDYWNRKTPPTLSPLIKYAIDTGWITNEIFSNWWDKVKMRAEERYKLEKLQEMQEKGLESIELDFSEIEITEEDMDWDTTEDIKESLTFQRNDYAHGSTILHSAVLGTFTETSEIINHIFNHREY